jgi:predicted amidophosphoribosyltransferase
VWWRDLLPWHSTRPTSPPAGHDRAIAAALLEQIASLVAPPLCAACGSARAAAAILCEHCDEELATAPTVIDAGPACVDLAVSAAPFEGVARRVVHGLKYARRLSLADVAAKAMLGALPPAESPVAVVPVPAGPWRWRWRGFDPAEEIGISLSERTGLPLRACLRRSHGRRQVGRRRSRRLADPPRVWAIEASPHTALLVDDVWTTGATLSASALALRDGGCSRVVALTLARAL